MEVDKDLAEEFKYLTQDDSEFIKKCSKFAEGTLLLSPNTITSNF